MQSIKLGQLQFQKKSKRKAGDGNSSGTFRFFTSSQQQSKWLEEADFVGPALIFGTGGSASIHYCDESFSSSTDCFILKSDREDVDMKYLYYFLRTNISILENGFKGAGLKHISKEYLSEIQIPLPSLEEQKSIIAKLDKLTDLIDLKKETIEKTEELTKSIFLEMFGDISINLKKWKIKKLDELKIDKYGIVDGPFGSSINTKVDYVEHGTIPVVRTKNVGIFNFKEEDLKFITDEKFELIKRSEVLPGDIILTKVGTIGNLCFFPGNYQRGVLSTTGSCRIRVNTSICNSDYLLYYLYLYREIMSGFVVTGVQPFLNMTHIKNFDILVPDISIQEKFSELFKKNNLLLIDQNKSLQKLQELYNTTTQALFSF